MKSAGCRNDSGSGSGAIDNAQLHTPFTQLGYKLLGADEGNLFAQEMFCALVDPTHKQAHSQ